MQMHGVFLWYLMTMHLPGLMLQQDTCRVSLGLFHIKKQHPMECCFCVLYKFLFPFKPYFQPLGLAGERIRIQAIRSQQRQQHTCHGKVYYKGCVAVRDKWQGQRGIGKYA